MPPATEVPRENQVPLCVDLDGTLIKTDLLWETFVRLLKQNPLAVLATFFWWLRGRAYLKQQLAARIAINPATLPYNERFLAFLREQKAAGRKLILATASDRAPATAVANYIGLFDEVLTSDGRTNLRSANKLRLLTERFGDHGFDYAGNSSVDYAVWRGSREAIVVNASASVARHAAECTKLGLIFEPKPAPFRPFLRCLRPHQWVKNIIIFVPILAAHKLRELPLLLDDAAAFAIFCLCASGVYIINDLIDLDADRVHSTKKFRPFASGNLPLQIGLALGPLLLLIGLLAAIWLSWPFAAVTAAYLVITTTYSWWVKRVALLDVFFLAGLYTIRLIAGHTATEIAFSAWLLMFSMFIFLSLALVKRYVELDAQQKTQPRASVISGRGYVPGDLELVTSLGTGSGYLAALVLALYVNSQQVVILYTYPNLLLLICPLYLYWISRVWLLSHRGEMHDDPVVFALKDKASYLIGALGLLVVWLASGH